MSEGDVCASLATLAELEVVLRRSKFDLYQPADIRSEFVTTLCQNIQLFAVSEADEADVIPPCSDPKDNKFLALTKVCSATALISSDADLRDMDPWRGIPIMAPAAFVALARP
ncbi:MAG: PIN domain-containing protein [Casimicrobiaceae bacterium]